MCSRALLVTAFATLACASDPVEPERPRMTRADLEEALRAIDPEASGRPGAIELTYNGVKMACISDTTFGRMRLVAPIGGAAELTPTQVGAILEANYHSALDARYALSQGILYAAFIHPLGPLTPEEILSAVRQVSNLVLTFGSSYSSGELQYEKQGQAL
jgi:hypothetical protein